MFQSHYSIAIIKPDAHRDVLAEMIMNDIREGGLEVIFVKDMCLSRDQAEAIYSEHNGKHNFVASVQSLLGKGKNNYATILIVKSECESSLGKLRRIKGRADKDGIRLKYKLYTGEELEKRGYFGEALKEELAKNRLHVPDTDELSISF